MEDNELRWHFKILYVALGLLALEVYDVIDVDIAPGATVHDLSYTHITQHLQAGTNLAVLLGGLIFAIRQAIKKGKG